MGEIVRGTRRHPIDIIANTMLFTRRQIGPVYACRSYIIS